MRDEKLYSVSWTQPYESWPEPEVPQVQEEDLALAREVLARIMSK